jgi:GTP:adenosylcobinamide-phosphate guanylyltransferase
VTRAETASKQSFTALVLAADRGPGDPVAQAAGVAYKCVVPVAGIPMLQRVVAGLSASPSVGRIAISLRDPGLAARMDGIAPLCESGRVVPLQAAGSPSQSVLKAVAELDGPFPLLVTTADHALLNEQMIEHFCAASRASGAAVTAGLTAAGLLLARYPESKRTYLRFRDERYSGSNLFALMNEPALAAAELWRQVERHRKRPWRMVAMFGPRLLAGYLLRRLTLDAAMALISTRLGLSVAAVKMPFAEAAIDVDKPEDLALVEAILSRSDLVSGRREK